MGDQHKSNNHEVSNIKSYSLPSEIKNHPGIQVVLDLGNYNLQDRAVQINTKTHEEVSEDTGESTSPTIAELLNKQPEDPTETQLMEISDKKGMSPIKRGSRIERLAKTKTNYNLPRGEGVKVDLPICYPMISTIL